MAKSKKEIEKEEIKLPTILNMRPGKWLFISSIILLLLAFFLICMLPGIVNGGRLVTFNSDLTNLGITLDGKYLGSTNDTIYFIESGKHSITYFKEGVVIGEEELVINHPIFFTLFSKRKTNIEVKPVSSLELVESVKDSFISDVYKYSKVTTYDEKYNYPPLAVNFAKDMIALSMNDISDEMYYFLLNTTSLTMKDDLDNALLLLEENNINYKNPNFENLYSNLESLFDEKMTTEITLNGLNTTQSPIKTTLSGIQFFEYEDTKIIIGEDTILSFPEVVKAPLLRDVEAFSISNLITEAQFAKFVIARPEWSKDNLDSLIADGLVDEYYLSGITLTKDTTSTKPIKSISYYAAIAYTEWLSAESGKEIRLPKEDEWRVMAESVRDKTYALSLNVIDFDTSRPTSVMGGLWEMTNTPFVPFSRISNYDKALEMAKDYDYYDIVIKGGSIANKASDITLSTVGVMSRSITSELTGFRVVMEK